MKCSECGRRIKPVVAIDIDGTLAEYHEHLLSFFDKYFGRPMPRGWEGDGEWEHWLDLSRQDYQAAKLAFRQGGHKRWMPIRRFAREMCETIKLTGAEVWITTTRPYLRLDSVDPDTREWLNRHGIVYDHMMYDEYKYMELSKQVGTERVVAIVDDLPEQWAQAQTMFGQTVPILVNRPHNAYYRRLMAHHEGNQFRGTLEEITAITVARVDDWNTRHAF